MKCKTIVDAAAEWVNSFNAVQRGMIEALMRTDLDSWHEITSPNCGDSVYVYEIPEALDTLEHGGNIESYDRDKKVYSIRLYDGKMLAVEEDDFAVEWDSILPMWGWLWSFGNSADDYWLEELDGVRLMSQCGFRIYEHNEWGYFFGTDGANYSFMDERWEPLYRARGLQWHDERAEHERQMLKKGYTKGKLGNTQVWLDEDNNVVDEVI